MSTTGFQLGWEEAEQARARREAVQDEERQAQLATIAGAGLTPEQQAEAIRTLYAKDPSALKQHIQNLAGRLIGRKPQPTPAAAPAPSAMVATPAAELGPGVTVPAGAPTKVTGPAPRTQKQALANILSKGTTPDQQKLAAYKAQLDADAQFDARTTQGKLNAVRKIQADPTLTEDEKRQLVGLYGVPNLRATTDEMKRQDYQALLVSGQVPKDTQGNPLSYEGWVAYTTAEGRTQGEPPKPGTPRVGVSGGKSVYGLLTPKGWVDAGTGRPLADFRPAPTYAQIAPSLRAVQVVDPNDSTSTIYESLPEAIKTRAKGTQSVDYKMQMPTATERSRADLAISAREQLGTMENILQNRSDLFGPSSGRYTNFTQWVGSQDPDAQRFAAAARIAADHLAGVFGGRSQAALQAIYDVIGKNTTNPAAAVAGLEQMNVAAEAIQSRGMRPAPRKGRAALSPGSGPGTGKGPAPKRGEVLPPVRSGAGNPPLVTSPSGFDWSKYPQ